MTTLTQTLTPQNVLEISQYFSTTDLNWLINRLKKLIKDKPLANKTSLDEAIQLYLAEKCSLGRAAELAGVTRWDIQDTLSQRGIPIEIYSGKSVEEMDALAERLEQKGLLCSL